mmetsp:Transcript_19853/g.52198  ORF Transcript_19853/g.52198 Transcript_19853/m.52198 type:complete len:396 (-) Transcript_19853:208-1395(-)
MPQSACFHLPQLVDRGEDLNACNLALLGLHRQRLLLCGRDLLRSGRRASSSSCCPSRGWSRRRYRRGRARVHLPRSARRSRADTASWQHCRMLVCHTAIAVRTPPTSASSGSSGSASPSPSASSSWSISPSAQGLEGRLQLRHLHVGRIYLGAGGRGARARVRVDGGSVDRRAGLRRGRAHRVGRPLVGARRWLRGRRAARLLPGGWRRGLLFVAPHGRGRLGGGAHRVQAVRLLRLVDRSNGTFRNVAARLFPQAFMRRCSALEARVRWSRGRTGASPRMPRCAIWSACGGSGSGQPLSRCASRRPRASRARRRPRRRSAGRRTGPARATARPQPGAPMPPLCALPPPLSGPAPRTRRRTAGAGRGGWRHTDTRGCDAGRHGIWTRLPSHAWAC